MVQEEARSLGTMILLWPRVKNSITVDVVVIITDLSLPKTVREPATLEVSNFKFGFLISLTFHFYCF